MDSLPLTVVAGYLGAGKTTLINQMLANNDGQRLALLVNDFGGCRPRLNLLGLLLLPLSFEGDTLLPSMNMFSFWY